MCKHHNRRTGPQPAYILLKPRQLLLSDCAEPFELRRIVQADEVNSFVLETPPASPHAPCAETLEIPLAVIAQQIVLAGDVEHLLLTQSSKELIERIELIGLRQMRKVPGMQDEIRLPAECVDLVHGGLEGCIHIGIGGLVEADVAVADLYKSEIFRMRLLIGSAHQAGGG